MLPASVSRFRHSYCSVELTVSTKQGLLSLDLGDFVLQFVDVIFLGLGFHDHRAQGLLRRPQLFLQIVDMSLHSPTRTV